MDTIFALSTAQGKAGVAVIRVSGRSAFDAIKKLAGDVPRPRHASLRSLKTDDGILLDEALVLTFEENRSFTGEETVEIHCHGSIAVVSAILEILSTYAELRPAEPGEFTRRALENGRLDLAQVEGLADLVEAETEAQRRQALRVFAGDLGKRAESWRGKLIRAAALIEATIDFADEEVPEDVSPEVEALLSEVMIDLEKEIRGVATTERVRTGFEVAIVGAPNVGKSTLLNMLAGRDAAITSEFAGTTRDVIEVRMDLDGLPVTLLDTAGLRTTTDQVETIGIDRAISRADAADIRVFLVEAGQQPKLTVRDGDIVKVAKADILSNKKQAISGLTGEGVSELIDEIVSTLNLRVANAGIATRVRHKQAMERGLSSLKEALRISKSDSHDSDLVAEELRTAVRALDSLVGRVDIENILDEIFMSFCLGK